MGSICLVYGLCPLCDGLGTTQKPDSTSLMVLEGIRLQLWYVPGWILINGIWLGREQGRVRAEPGLWLEGPDWVMPEFLHLRPAGKPTRGSSTPGMLLVGVVVASAG